MKDLKHYNGWALVTGASSGLGREFARQIAAAGVNCVLVGLGEEALSALAHELSEKHAIACRPLELDLASDRAVARLVEFTSDIPIGILVNCAGVAHGGNFETRDPAKLELLVKLNCLAPVLLTRAYLPQMFERNAGAVIIVSSLQAFISCPYESVYCGSKAFLLHFGESLWGELRNSPIDCLTVCPAGMKTDFFRTEGFSKEDCDRIQQYSSTPESIAALALNTLGKRAIAAPFFTQFAAFLVRLSPRWLTLRLVRLITRQLVNHAGL
ncbi:MAG: SDR family NAD(P)-dependent oxidoreductase [Candidatus Hydrogenedentes bacterium]|nr:SDR family NAD(P)-dependent oxidoreductase [Candidatus Hydrogenedentota bacterium]